MMKSLLCPEDNFDARLAQTKKLLYRDNYITKVYVKDKNPQETQFMGVKKMLFDGIQLLSVQK